MRKAVEIIRLMLLQSWKDKSNILWMIALPIVFSFIAGSMMGGSNEGLPKDDIPIAITDEDHSALSHNIIGAIDRHERYVAELMDESELRRGVQEADYGAGLLIPAGFERSLSQGEPQKARLVAMDMSNIAMGVSQIALTQVQRHVTAGEAGDVASQYAGREDLRQQVYGEVMAALDQEAMIDVKYTLAASPEKPAQDPLSSVNRTFAGFMVMFVMFTVTYAAGDILDERKYKTWFRLMTAPVSRTSVMGGKLGGAYIMGIIQVAILLGIGTLLFGVKLQGNVSGFMLVMAAFLLAVTGIGLFLATVVKTMGQLQGLAALLITATSMLAGTFWPVEVTSPTMQAIASFMPQYWAIKGFTDATVLNASMAALWPGIGVSLLFAGVFFAAAVLRLRRQFGSM